VPENFQTVSEGVFSEAGQGFIVNSSLRIRVLLVAQA
jgi:hypothetical protein